MSFKRISGDAVSLRVDGNGKLAKPRAARTAHGAGELITFTVRDGAAVGEALFGSECLSPVGDAVVGQQSCAFKVIQRPASWSAVSTGEIVREVFDDAVAGFAGAVVTGAVGRREQERDTMMGEKIAGVVGGECGSIIGLQDQRWIMVKKKTAQEGDGGFCVVGMHRVGSKDAAGGEVADGKYFSAVTFDGRWRCGVVHGPDRARGVPGEYQTSGFTGEAFGFRPGTVQ